MSRVLDDPLPRARDALKRHAWGEALELLQRADGEGTLSPEELELLGEAAWWSGRMDECISAKERAYAGYVEAGDTVRAAMVALLLVRDHGARLAKSVAAGWFRRAERLLQGREDTPQYGYLLVFRARAAFADAEFEEVERLATEAVERGAAAGDPDLQAFGLMYQGMANVARGQVEEGFGYLDEATVAAVGGELSPYVTGVVYCNTISTCAEIGDYRRAGEWTDAAKRWCERQAITGFPGVCRVHRAEIMRLRGWWSDAERDARQASTELIDHGLPALAAEGFNEVGVIRLRMGDLAEAEDAFRQSHELGHDPQPGLALLRIAQGRTDVAQTLLRRALAETTEPLHRARLLPVWVDVSAATGALDEAHEAVAELDATAESYGSEMLRAAAAGARSALHLAEGRAEEALRDARQAWKLWQDLEAPYEAAVARLSTAMAYRLGGDEETAAAELRAALSTFDRLGATVDGQRVRDLLGDDTDRPAARRVTRTFMFTDIVRSTNLVEAIGDEAWEDLVAWHDRALRQCFARRGGEEVDHAGDGFFVAFDDASSALTCAVEIQRALSQHRREHGFAPQVRVGLHAAEATQGGGDYRGHGVHEAARIGALAEGGEVLVSTSTLEAADGEWPVGEPRRLELKGISEPVEVVSVDWSATPG